MNVVIADTPPDKVVQTVIIGGNLGGNPPSLWLYTMPGPRWYRVPLFGDGAALATGYERAAFRDPEAEVMYRLVLADWIDDNQSDLALPDHLRHLVGQAVRDGCPDAAAGNPLEVAR